MYTLWNGFEVPEKYNPLIEDMYLSAVRPEGDESIVEVGSEKWLLANKVQKMLVEFPNSQTFKRFPFQISVPETEPSNDLVGLPNQGFNWPFIWGAIFFLVVIGVLAFLSLKDNKPSLPPQQTLVEEVWTAEPSYVSPTLVPTSTPMATNTLRSYRASDTPTWTPSPTQTVLPTVTPTYTPTATETLWPSSTSLPGQLVELLDCNLRIRPQQANEVWQFDKSIMGGAVRIDLSLPREGKIDDGSVHTFYPIVDPGLYRYYDRWVSKDCISDD